MKKILMAVCAPVAGACLIFGLAACDLFGDKGDGKGDKDVHVYTAENKCEDCDAVWEFTQGLTFEENDDGAYTVTGLGNADVAGKELVIPYGYNGKFVTEIGQHAFDYGAFTSVVIPSSVTGIEFGAFWGCASLASITIPEGVQEIAEYAFYQCAELSNVTFPESLNKLGGGAFTECNKLTSVELPKGLSDAGGGPFFACASLTEIKVAEGNRHYSSLNGVLCNKEQTQMIEVPMGMQGELFIPESVVGFWMEENSLTGITVAEGNTAYSSLNGALYNKEKTTLIRVPGRLEGAFAVPDGVTAIGGGAFSHCKALTSVTVADSVTEIGNLAFSQSSLTDIALPSGITKIAEGTFSRCDSLASITIPEGVTKIEEDAFGSCRALTHITLPDSLTSIATAAFNYCDKLTEVTIPDGVKKLETRVFGECYALTKVTLPKGLTSIGQYAFDNCWALQTIEYRGTTKQWKGIYKEKWWDNFTEEITIVCTDGNILKASTLSTSGT